MPVVTEFKPYSNMRDCSTSTARNKSSLHVAFTTFFLLFLFFVLAEKVFVAVWSAFATVILVRVT